CSLPLIPITANPSKPRLPTSTKNSPTSTNKVSGQSPKIIHVVVRQDIPEQVADAFALRDLSILLSSMRKNLRQRSVSQQIPRNCPQRFARIEHIAIGIHPWKHRRKTLERLETQESLDASRRSVDSLRARLAPRDDFVH